jgi:preprotein translocase SecE subunit
VAKEETKVTRISASDGQDQKKEPKSSKKEEKSTPRRMTNKSHGTPVTYLKGAWYELRQVRWPTRQATWGFTGAVLAFSAFFVIFILLLDALFQYLFQLIIK